MTRNGTKGEKKERKALLTQNGIKTEIQAWDNYSSRQFPVTG